MNQPNISPTAKQKHLTIILVLLTLFTLLGYQMIQSVFSEMKKTELVNQQLKGKRELWFKQFEALDLKVTALSQKKISTDLVLINFWASWCTPCLNEIPSLMKFKQKIAANPAAFKSLTLIAINGDNVTGPIVEKILLKGYQGKPPLSKTLGMEFDAHHIADPEGSLQQALDIRFFPSTFVFDVKEGTLLFESMKEVDFNQSSELENLFKK